MCAAAVRDVYIDRVSWCPNYGEGKTNDARSLSTAYYITQYTEHIYHTHTVNIHCYATTATTTTISVHRTHNRHARERTTLSRLSNYRSARRALFFVIIMIIGVFFRDFFSLCGRIWFFICFDVGLRLQSDYFFPNKEEERKINTGVCVCMCMCVMPMRGLLCC